MKISLVAPELQKLAKRNSVPLPMGNALGRRVLRALGRLVAPNPKKLHGITLEVRPETRPPMRIYQPQERKSEAALLWIHGGGFVLGNAALDDRFCAFTAQALGIVVVSVDYRLAPENPFPVPLDDCHAAWTWMQENAASLGIDPKRIAIGGQSAGGALAASLVQRVHDEGGNKAAAQWLFCPMLDDRTATRQELDAMKHWVWTSRSNATGWRLYLSKPPGSAAFPPYAVPARREDLRGLPPAWIGVGDIDLLHNESRNFAGRLQASGTDTRFVSVQGAPHGFESWAFDTKMAQEFIADAQRWLRQALRM
ncbi:alpha/beta hydrolase [Bradyrhizobium cajani]|uniref:Alpha/beta hydrolase fold domain-containing protein n=1 Tax=Bradyrhizobium cajani TaxID=1928661 RepID=A0A844TGP0_9BRAD|nr:alpha/beta hydrolase [Bradyrhizobium cajani]MCP3368186.1 alpha/beta hydrolase [Bradyrhizobium cajani]MVT76735.1 alpha/beta hydrolase fold domain-containing protein [Bradyrhizobium cajani]